MLLEITIKNYIIIEQERILFDKGLNIITGETGSGKSLVIDALNAIMGGRFSKEDIRKDAEKATVEAMFSIEGCSGLNECLNELGIDREEDNSLLVVREVNHSGKSICRINGQTVTLSMLRRVAVSLMDIVGQNEHQQLLNVSRHIDYVDSFDDVTIAPLKCKLVELVSSIKEQQKKLAEISGNAGERERKLDLLRFQLDDIENAKLKIGEDTELRNRRTRLVNAEKLIKGINLVYQNVYKGDKQSVSAMELLNDALSAIDELMTMDPEIKRYKDLLENCIYSMEDMKSDIRSYRETIEFSPDEIEACEERLDHINKVKRKYGSTIEEVLAYKDEINSQYEKLVNSEKISQEIEKKIESLTQEYSKIAVNLSKCRKTSAKKLEKLVEKELGDLNMSGAKFHVRFHEFEGVSANGFDKVEFLLSPNPGEPEKPLVKIASGGETSRVMLAIKNVLTGLDEVPCVVFDEVDAGIGGLTARMVGQKIKSIASVSQVICITHLPQIASFADTHIYIDKVVKKDKTYTKIRSLDEQERIVEIARMIGGNADVESSMNHAREMLKSSK